MNTDLKQTSNRFLFATALAAIAVAFTGCGKPQFSPMAGIEAQSAPGYFVIPPKVDILLSIDNTGSMAGTLYNSVRTSLPGFLSTLDKKQWDYHLAAIPLVTETEIRHVTASRFDSNYGSAWLAPFPGALPTAPGMIVPEYFLPLSRYLETDIVPVPDTSTNGAEPAFRTIHRQLTGPLPETGFIRSDALLVILALSSGEDTSGVIICKNTDGYYTPFENRRTSVSECWLDGQPVPVPTAGTLASSYSHYEQAIKGLKDSPAQIKFYSAVNLSASGPYAPTRYKAMATATGGASYSISNIGGVLDSLSQNLQAQRLTMTTRYLFISDQPDLASITVTKFVDGSRPVVIPQDATNGWTYAGWLDNAYSIDYPIPMNQRSGYAIELHGTAKLQGNDTADVQFNPAR